MGVLIFRESQHRKAEAAAIAAESKKSSLFASPRRTSTRKRTVVKRDSIVAKLKARNASTKRKTQPSKETKLTQQKFDWKKYQKKCMNEGCTNHAKRGGLCIRHGAKVKRCSSEGCTNTAQNGGVCMRHGAKVKRCISEGCTNIAKKGGMCWRHRAYRNTND